MSLTSTTSALVLSATNTTEVKFFLNEFSHP